MENKNTLYILIDKTLDPVYGAVQGGHAVAEWMMYNSESHYNKFACETQVNWIWENDYLVYLKVDIKKWRDMLRDSGTKALWEVFCEPDLDNRATAIALHSDNLDPYLQHMIKKEELL